MPSKAYLAQLPVAAYKRRGEFVMAPLQGASCASGPGLVGFAGQGHDRDHPLLGGGQQLGREKLSFIP